MSSGLKSEGYDMSREFRARRSERRAENSEI